MTLQTSPLHTVSLRCASQTSNPQVHTAQIEQRSPPRRVVNGIFFCVLSIATAMLVGCGGGASEVNSSSGSDLAGAPVQPSEPIQAPIVSQPPSDPIQPPIVSLPPSDPIQEPSPVVQCGSGLAALDLAGQCRTASPTPGALEANDGTSIAGASVLSLAVAESASSSLHVSWQPFGTNTAGYMVYYGATAETVNVLVSDLALNSGLYDASAPGATYDSVPDLGMYAGDTVCFRIHAYDPARTTVGQIYLDCRVI